MDWAVIGELVLEHLGEIVLGLEFFLLQVFGKNKTPEEKQAILEAKEAKRKEKNALLAAKYISKAKSVMPGVDQESEV